MADNPVGSLSVRITGDFSDLSAKLQAATTEAESGGQQIASAFELAMTQAAGGVDAVTVSVKQMQAAFAALQDNPAITDLQGELNALVGAGLTAGQAAVALAEAYAQVAISADTTASSITALSTATNASTTSMTAASAQMNLGFSRGLNDLGSQTSLFNTELQNLSIVQGQMGASGAAAWEAQTTAAGASVAATEQATASMAISYGQVIQLAIAFKLLESVIVSALETAGKWERVNEALVATTGNVQGVADAMTQIPALADSIGVSIESVQQGFVRLARYGLDLKAIPGILTDIQSGAIASGTSFDTVANAWERAVNTGTIMTRTVQNMGLNMRDLAAAMGMVGHTDTEVGAAFKGIQDSLDGTSAATLRTTILMAALPDKVKGLATSVDDTTKSFVQLKNAVTETMDKLGTALEQVGQGGGLTAIKVVLATVATAVLGLITVFGELAKTIDAVANVLIDAFAAIGAAMVDALSGNFKKAADDLQAGGQKMVKDWMTISGEMAAEFTSTGKALDEMWGNATKTSAASTAAIGTAAQGMASQVAQSTGTASDGTKTLAEAMVYVEDATAKATGSMVSNFQQLGTVANQALTNAVAAFDKAAAAFFSGAGSATEYSKALKALDAAQKDVSAGLENQKTSMLIVANTYREMGVAVSNAHTTLSAVSADMANGMASATQYTAALKALNKAQEDMSGGVQNLHTALALVVDDHRQLEVALKNAETWLKAVYQEYLNHKASLGQLEAAISAVDKAQRALNDGLASYATQLAKTSADYQNIQIAATNAATALRAVNAEYLAGRATLEQLSLAAEAYVKAQEKAQGGAESWASAELKLLDSQDKLQLAYQNANTELAKATGLYNSGAIGLGVYEKAVQAAKSAHDALLGVHQQQTQAVSQLASAIEAYTQAQQRATNAAQSALSVGYNLHTQQLDLETALRQANIQLEEATRLFNEGAVGSGVLERAIQATDTALKNLGTTTEGMTTDMRSAATAIDSAAQAMNKLGSAASTTGAALKGVGKGGLGGGSASGSFASSPEGDPGNLNIQMKPGDTWDFGTAMRSAIFGMLVEFGGPASMGFGTGSQATSGTFGTPQELAALAVQQAQAQQSLLKYYQDLIAATHGTATAVTTLGTAATTAADKLNTTYQNAFTALQDATTQFQAGLIDLATYNKSVQAYQVAQDALTKTVNLANVPMQLLGSGTSALASVWGNLTPAVSSTADSFIIATDVVSTFAQQATIAATALSGVSDTLASASTSIATAVTVAQGVMATIPIMLGSQLQQLTQVVNSVIAGQGAGSILGSQLPTPVLNPIATNVSALTPNHHTLGLGAQGHVNIDVTVTGTLVGSGGIQELSNKIWETGVQTLASRGIRLTRG